MTPSPLSPSDGKAPSAARMYNYLLGGTDNFAVDREAAETLKAFYPTVQAAARANRGLLLRSVRAMAEAGIRQFLDIGCGLPLDPNVHDVARGLCPDARVVYIDSDPTVVAYGQALMSEAGVAVLPGDLRDPDAILATPEVSKLLDPSEPVGVITVAIWHFIPEDGALQFMARLRAALAPGSFLAITHVCSDTMPKAEVTAGKAVYQQTTNPVRPRSREEIGAFFDGFELLDPGLVPLADWRPYEGDPFPDRAPESLAGVGVLR